MYNQIEVSDGISLVREKRILYIRDGVGHINNIRRAVEENECALLMCDVGMEGVMLAKQYLPDLILADVRDPNLDSLEVIRDIRSSGLSHLEQVPVIGITKEDFPGDLYQEVVSSGVDEILGNLVEIHMIQSRIASHL